MSAASAVARAWLRPSAWLWPLILAFLSLVMARAVREDVPELRFVNAMVWLVLLANHIGAQWSQFLASESFALVPRHARLQHIAVLGICSPLLAAFALGMFLVGHQAPAHAFSGMLVCLGTLQFFRTLSLAGLWSRLTLFAAILGPLCVWQVSCAMVRGQWIVDLLLILASGGLWVFVWRDLRVSWRPLGKPVAQGLAIPWLGRRKAGAWAPVSGVLAAARLQIRAWTTLWQPICLAALSAIAGLVAAIIPGDSDALAFTLLIAAFEAPIFFNLLLVSGILPGHLSLERVRILHRGGAAAAILLALTGWHLILAVSGAAGVLVAWTTWRLATGGAAAELAWWYWPVLVVMAPASAAVLSMLNLRATRSVVVVSLTFTVILLPLLANSVARRHIESLLAGHSALAVLSLAGLTGILVLATWRRLSSMELP